MNLTSTIVKEIAAKAGADLCGIAAVDRFHAAPRGFHPTDIFPRTRSVLVAATRFPEAPFHARTMVPYTAANDALLERMTGILCTISLALEGCSAASALPLPGEPYDYWDEKKHEGRGNLSLKHAGQLAGLGTIGRNTLLATPRFGNRIVLGAVLLDIDLESDPVMPGNACPEGCRLCMDACPVGAIDGQSVNQMRCRRHSGTITPKGYALYTCFRCREVCPNGRGTAHSEAISPSAAERPCVGR